MSYASRSAEANDAIEKEATRIDRYLHAFARTYFGVVVFGVNARATALTRKYRQPPDARPRRSHHALAVDDEPFRRELPPNEADKNTWQIAATASE